MLSVLFSVPVCAFSAAFAFRHIAFSAVQAAVAVDREEEYVFLCSKYSFLYDDIFLY
jgi:hypothetical protein